MSYDDDYGYDWRCSPTYIREEEARRYEMYEENVAKIDTALLMFWVRILSNELTNNDSSFFNKEEMETNSFEKGMEKMINVDRITYEVAKKMVEESKNDSDKKKRKK